MYFEQVMSMIRREVIRTMRKFHQQSRIGLVSSYNPQLHAVKVLFQPSGTESGWIPLTALAVGNQFGILSAPNIRDEVEVTFQEGEHMVARVTARHFNKLDQPPQIQPGEHIIIHQKGGTSYWKSDGSVVHAGPNYTQTGQPQSGVSGNTSTGGQSGNTNSTVPMQQQQPVQKGKQAITFGTDGSRTDTVPQGPMSTTVQGNYSRTSQQGSITDTASTISHDGNTTVAGNLNVSQNVAALSLNVGTASLAVDESGHIVATSGVEVSGGFSTDTLATSAPSTITTSTYTVGASDISLVFNTSATCTLTLPTPSSNVGRWLYLKTIAAQAINSASSNVAPISSATPGTSILANTAGTWVALHCDGTNWITMMGGS